MFMRPQVYQRSCLFDALQTATILQHESSELVELLLAVKRLAHAVTLYGDSHSCEAASEQQEGEVIKLLKSVIAKCWSHAAAATARARVASFKRVQHVIEAATAKIEAAEVGRQNAISQTKHVEEQGRLAAMSAVADAICADITKAGDNLHVAGAEAIKLQRPDLLYFNLLLCGPFRGV
jgi:hypothetical protein